MQPFWQEDPLPGEPSGLWTLPARYEPFEFRPDHERLRVIWEETDIERESDRTLRAQLLSFLLRKIVMQSGLP